MADDRFPDHDGDSIPDPFDEDWDGELDLQAEVADGWTAQDVLDEVRSLPAVEAAKATRPSGTVALLGLISVALIASASLAVAIVMPALWEGLGEVDSSALNALTNIALLSVGALSAVLGVRD